MKLLVLFCSLLLSSTIFAQDRHWLHFDEVKPDTALISHSTDPGPAVDTMYHEESALRMDVDAIGYTNVALFFGDTLNITSNPQIKFKAKATVPFDLRLDLGDKPAPDTSKGLYTNARPIIVEVGTEWKEYIVTFKDSWREGQVWPYIEDVNSEEIVSLMLFFNPAESYEGTVWIDSVLVGDTSDIPYPLPDVSKKIFVNQLGYEQFGPKKAVYQSDDSTEVPTTYRIRNMETRKYLQDGVFGERKTVPGWRARNFWEIDFSHIVTPGRYKLKVGSKYSTEFVIEENALLNGSIAQTLNFFKEIRSVDGGDSSRTLYGRGEAANVYGGWKDASGDPGKHMSHLSYANYFNPQQIPFVAWSIMESYDLIKDQVADYEEALIDESLWGADYLMRNRDADTGYFYLAVFDNWGDTTSPREVTEWGQLGNDRQRSSDYQCAMREGGGLAIAALAKAYNLNLASPTYTQQQYLDAAKQAYAHLKSPGNGFATKNLEYCNDHKENIIDEYCGLLAATELYIATQEAMYLQDANAYANRILARQQDEGWLISNDGTRPFFHAADEGMPTVALIKLTTVDDLLDAEIKAFLQKQNTWYTQITHEITNPFSYVRQYNVPYDVVTGEYGDARTAFFVPQQNETGYWWQGENARLLSMSTAFLQSGRFLAGETYKMEEDPMSAFGIAQIDWVLGKNPYDICMMYGVGKTNYPEYVQGAKGPNIVGGICNGITNHENLFEEMEFMPFDNGSDVAWRNWRWIEQWIPHDAWYLLSVATLAKNQADRVPVLDCNNEEFGLAFMDTCGICAGGSTGVTPILDMETCILLSNDELLNDGTLNLFPNPTSSQLNFGMELTNGAVYNAQGVLIRAFVNATEINVSSLEKGVYFLKSEQGTSKFVVK